VRELGDGYGGTGVPVSASVSPARAREREKRMSAREGVEVFARCSTRARARDVEGTAALGRHASPFFCPRAMT
jgi:hypothetical protein